MGAMTLYLAFCGGLSAGGGFYMERKKLAWRAAGAGRRGDFEGSRQQYRRIGGGAS